MRIWACVNRGLPDVMATDQGPEFTFNRGETFANLVGIRYNLSGVHSHNALGVGGRYHSFLRSIYRRVRQGHPNLGKSFALSLSEKTMNDTAGYKGLVPTLLVFLEHCHGF